MASVKSTQEILQNVEDDSNNAIRVNLVAGGAGAGGAGDGSILDGVSSSIKATVLDLTNSNPLTVAMVGTDGTQITPLNTGSGLPARVATTDSITAKLATDAIQNGLTALTPKFAVIDHAVSGDNTIVAAVASKKIRVLSLFLVAAAAVTVRFESGASGTALTGQMNVAANGGFVLPFNPVGWFETAASSLLNLELSGAVSVDGSLCYVEV